MTTTADIHEILAKLEKEVAGVSDERDRLARREIALNKSISGLRELISLNGGGALSPAAEEPQVPKNAFAKLEIVPGAIAYLTLMGKPQTNRQVVDGLIAGGKKSTGGFRDTVRSVLHRDRRKEHTKLRWINNQWALKEWPEPTEPEES